MLEPAAQARRRSDARAGTAGRALRRARGLIPLAALLTIARPAAALEPGQRFDQYAHLAWPSVAHASSVYTILPGRSGALWLGTSDGLVRFDGQRMTTFESQRLPGIVERNVRALHEAPDGSLWIAALGDGLARLHGDGRSVTSWRGGDKPESYLRALLETSDGTVWGAGQEGVVRLVSGGDQPLLSGEGLPSADSRALALDGGELVVGTSAGLARWNGQPWRPEPGEPGRATIDVLLAEPDGTLWVGTRGGGLWRRQKNAWRRFGVDAGLGSDQVSALRRDRAGRLWVATRGADKGTLAWLDGDRFRTFPLPPKLCPDRIQALAEDGDGGLWIGTELCGLHRLADRPFQQITTADGLPSNFVLGLGSDRQGHVVVGTRGGGMARLRASWRAGERPLPLTCSPGLPCDECWDFSSSARADGAFWSVCRWNVVLFWDGQTMARHPPLPGELPRASFALEARDRALWLAVDKTVVRSHAGTVMSVHEQEPFEGYRILFEARDGTLWIAADDGLARWRAGETRIVRLPPAERPAEVASFHEDAAGTLWLATKGEGIRRVRGERIDTIGVAAGLPTGWIVQLLEDGQGRLWASSSKGIFWVNKRELEEVAEGRRARVQPSLYDANDGIQMRSESFGHPAGFKDARGRLWFATNSGVTVVDPAWRTRPPRVSIDELRLGGERVDWRSGRVPVASGPPRDLDLGFSALSFEPADTIAFRYQLREGNELHAAVDLGASRSLHLERLPPGSYQVSIEARTRDGDWTGTPATVAFELRPPFYRSPVLLLAGVVLVALSLSAVHRARIARTRAELQAVMAERTRIAREVHDTLAQAFVATSVQLECLEEALESDPRGRVRHHLDTAKRVVEESLDEARRAVWVLRPQAIEPGLVSALETLVKRLAGGVPVELRVTGTARALPPLVASNLLKIAAEAVANAHRHARALRIDVHLAFAPGSVTLSVVDDGEGMPAPAAEAPGAGGILGMKERAAQIAGRFSIGAEGRGTTVRVEVAT